MKRTSVAALLAVLATVALAGKLELPLELARGDAAMEIAATAILVLLLAGHDQQVGFAGDLDLVAREAGHSDADLIAVLVALLDIIGRIALGLVGAGGVLEQIEDTIETDRRPAVWGEIKGSTHNQILQ